VLLRGEVAPELDSHLAWFKEEGGKNSRVVVLGTESPFLGLAVCLTKRQVGEIT